jgi:4-hydroxybenzoate polyprenyltransferase
MVTEQSAKPAAGVLECARLLRPKQWVKNVFVLAPAIFAEHMHEWPVIRDAAVAVACFCLLSSAVYIVNDIVDRKADALHPRKRRRPIAAGTVSVALGIAIALAMTGLAFVAAAYELNSNFMGWMAAYLGNSALYIAIMKQRVIVDVLSIATGFVIRLLAGCVAVQVEASSWLIICGFSLALVLGFGKRLAEVTHKDVTRHHRATLISYDREKLNFVLAVSTAVCLLAYMLYTLAPETYELHRTRKLFYTVPIVAYGLFRYCFKANEAEGDGPTEILIGDPIFLATGVLWGATVLAVLWWK